MATDVRPARRHRCRRRRLGQAGRGLRERLLHPGVGLGLVAPLRRRPGAAGARGTRRRRGDRRDAARSTSTARGPCACCASSATGRPTSSGRCAPPPTASAWPARSGSCSPTGAGAPTCWWATALAVPSGWSERTGATVLLAEPSPTLAIDGQSWDEFLASKSKNFRDQVRRRERKLAKSHELSFRLSDAARLDEDMGILLQPALGPLGGRVRRLRAGARGVPPRVRRRGPRARLAAPLARRGGRHARCAAWYGLRYAGCECFYQSGRDPAWDEHSVGFVLLAHTIRSAFEDGMREYRFLRGGDAYKGRFADGDPGLETVVLGRGSLRPAGRGRRRRARAPASRGSPARPGEQPLAAGSPARGHELADRPVEVALGPALALEEHGQRIQLAAPRGAASRPPPAPPASPGRGTRRPRRQYSWTRSSPPARTSGQSTSVNRSPGVKSRTRRRESAIRSKRSISGSAPVAAHSQSSTVASRPSRIRKFSPQKSPWLCPRGTSASRCSRFATIDSSASALLRAHVLHHAPALRREALGSPASRSADTSTPKRAIRNSRESSQRSVRHPPGVRSHGVRLERVAQRADLCPAASGTTRRSRTTGRAFAAGHGVHRVERHVERPPGGPRGQAHEVLPSSDRAQAITTLPLSKTVVDARSELDARRWRRRARRPCRCRLGRLRAAASGEHEAHRGAQAA